MQNKTSQNNLIIPSLIISLGFIVFGFMLKSGFDNFSNKTDTLSVTGSSEREVVSDLAKWNITIQERFLGDKASQDGVKKVEADFLKIKNFLIKNGIEIKNIQIQPASLTPICEIGQQGYENCALGIRGQIVSKVIVAESSNVESIKNLSQKITLEMTDVALSQNTVEYLYNNLKNIRAEMLSEATKNAKERAVAVAEAGGANIGKIISLSSGVFQLTAKNSIEVDGYGAYDTGSIDKKVTATVKANFSVK